LKLYVTGFKYYWHLRIITDYRFLYLFKKIKLYSNHLFLALFWIIYCVLHSILATEKVKTFFEKTGQNFLRYYRLAYSIFAFITLAFLLYYQYSFSSYTLLHWPGGKYFAIIILVLPGLIIMGISILKYFKLLSGVRSLYQVSPVKSLKLSGIHKYVRHPLYLGTLLFIWGLFFVFPLLNNLIAVIIMSLYTIIGTRLEEKKLLLEFGDEYVSYIKSVPGIIPNFKKN
jgi:methanethiol S-methyltransferase